MSADDTPCHQGGTEQNHENIQEDEMEESMDAPLWSTQNNKIAYNVTNHETYLDKRGKTLLACQLCSYLSVSRQSLLRHMRKYHRIENSQFLELDFLSRISNSLTTGENMAGEETNGQNDIDESSKEQCDLDLLCEQSLKELGLMNGSETQRLVKEVLKNIYSCRHCHYRSTSRNNVKRHMRRHSFQKHLVVKSKPRKAESANEISAEETLSQEDKVKGQDDEGLHSLSGTPDSDQIPEKVFGTDLKDRPFLCKICNYSCVHRYILKKHLKSHRNIGPQKCALCNYITYSRYGIEKHRRSHREFKRFQCDKCGYQSQVRGNLNRHMKVHSEEAMGKRKYKCDLCQYICYHWTSLKRHMEEHSSTESTYMCEVCGYTTHQLEDLEKHARVHTGERPYVCTVCGYNSSTNCNLRRHMKRHRADEPYTCSFCCFTCTSPEDKDSHFNDHPGEKPYPCESCPFRSRHKIFMDDYQLNYKRENRFICQFCGLSYVCKSALNMHLKKHTGKDLFQCDHCDYCTPRKYDLQQHERMHTGDMYTCHICGYKTNFKTNLVRHFRRHSLSDPPTPGDRNHIFKINEGESLMKPYSCNECDFHSRYKSLFMAHKRKHETMSPYKCKLCEFRTKSQFSLDAHMKLHLDGAQATDGDGVKCIGKMNGRTVLMCTVCGYRTLYKGNLTRHMVKHERGKRRRGMIEEANKVSQENYIKFKKERNGINLMTDEDVLFKLADKEVMNEVSIRGETVSCISNELGEFLTQQRAPLKTEVEPIWESLPVDCNDLIVGEEVIGYAEDIPQEETPAIVIQSQGVARNEVLVMFICGICDFSTSTQEDLEKHLESHDSHSVEYTVDVVTPEGGTALEDNKSTWSLLKSSPSFDAKMFACDVCGFESKYKANVKAHAKLHGSERPFMCDLCNYSTVYKSALKVHKRKHTREGLLQCTFCPYSTVIQHDFTKHNRIHTGDKPYLCDICGYKSRFRSNWLRHNWKHRKDPIEPNEKNIPTYGKLELIKKETVMVYNS